MEAKLQSWFIIRVFYSFTSNTFVVWSNCIHTTVTQQVCPFDPHPPAGGSCHCTPAPDFAIRRRGDGWGEQRHDILCNIFRLLLVSAPSSIHHTNTLFLSHAHIHTHRESRTLVQARLASNSTHNGSFPQASRVATVA